VGNLHASVAVLYYERFKIARAEGGEWPNMCFDIADGYFDEATIDHITKEMTARGMRPTIILQYDETQAGLLKKKGYFPVDQWLGMSCTTGLDAQRQPAPERSDAACFVIGDGEEAAQWTAVVSETLFGGKPVDTGIFRGLQPGGAILVGVRMNEVIAGSSMVYFDRRGVAGIYMVGVRSAYRKMGLGRKLIAFCCDRIREKGVEECCLQSTRMATGLYRAMGFKESDRYLIYCKIK
jgi:ribosomal protein S18 acetylase RimI-like enzyme